MLTITHKISLLLAALAMALVPASALARNGADDTQPDDNGGERTSSRDEKRVGGNCTGSASSKLKAKNDGGRIETEFEVDQNRNGVTWSVRFRLNGVRVVKTTATTKAPSGSFSVERRLANPAGADDIVAKAISPSGQVCRASLTI